MSRLHPVNEPVPADISLGRLDERIGFLETQDAVRIERDVHIDRRFDRLEAMQKDTQGTLNRLGWLIISAVILAALAALMSGALISP